MTERQRRRRRKGEGAGKEERQAQRVDEQQQGGKETFTDPRYVVTVSHLQFSSTRIPS